MKVTLLCCSLVGIGTAMPSGMDALPHEQITVHWSDP